MTEASESSTTKKSSTATQPPKSVDPKKTSKAFLSGVTVNGQKMRFCPECHEKPLSKFEVDPETLQNVQVRICPLKKANCTFIQ